MSDDNDLPEHPVRLVLPLSTWPNDEYAAGATLDLDEVDGEGNRGTVSPAVLLTLAHLAQIFYTAVPGAVDDAFAAMRKELMAGTGKYDAKSLCDWYISTYPTHVTR